MVCHGLRLRKDEREKLMVVSWVEVSGLRLVVPVS